MFWWIVLAVVVLVVVFVAYPRKRYFPGPKIYGYLGTVAASRHINDRHRYWRSWHEKFRVVQFQRGNTPIFVVFEPEDFRFVFSNKEVFGDRPRAVLSALGRNVLSMEVGTEWAEHRRLLSPLFAEKYMREYVTMMDSKLLSLSGRLRKSAGAPVDALQVMMSAALDVIGVCGFGVDFQCLETADVQTPFMKASNTLLEEGARANLVPWYIRMFEFARKRNLSNAVATIRQQCDAVRRLFNEMRDSNEFNRKAMITELFRVEEAGEFTAAQVTSEMAVMLLAGHETTATTITWALYYLARNEALQRRLQAEVDSALKQPGATTDAGALGAKVVDYLPLCKATMMETMRMRPTVAGVARRADRAFSFPDSDVVLPKGSLVLCSFYSQSLNRKVWGDDCEEFKIERHLGAEAEKRDPYAFMPFGGGIRVCLGKRFAVLEGQLLLMQLMRTFTVSLPPNAPEPGERLDITLKPTNLRVIFTPRA